MVLTPFDWTLYLCPGEGSVQILQEWLGPVDVTLRGSPAAFAQLGLSADSHGELFAGRVAVTGDMHVARHFQRLFDKLDIDWEEHVSHLTGDLLASQLGGMVRAGRHWLSEAHKTFRLNLAEFLQEESRDLPAALEADAFYGDVDRLRADVDRLEARTARLRAALSGD
ncbi:ubiquinone biosynthesis accessory factor UbiJ [Methylogaea oryzae]|uniref:ubiquinone biosynthesis accessory factor UbiJ n=1 Tax=Methylogaea oryzae TaxID=1295382 RepID=UPI0030DD5B56